MLAATYVLFQGVVLRYLFNYAFPWTEEVVRYSIVWLVFLGGSIAARRGAHISMDILVVYLPPRAKLFVMGIAASAAVRACPPARTSPIPIVEFIAV